MTTDTPAKQTSFEETVNSIVAEMTQSEDGTWQLPEEKAAELDEPTKYAVTAERRRRDTQAAYSKSQNETKRLKTENELLAKAWEEDVTSTLTAAQRDELDELKVTDPDAWRTKINEYEQANKNSFGTKRQEIGKKASDETEIERRERVMAEFNEAHPGFTLTDDIIANDLPPRYLKQLETGDISFEDFLAKAHKFLEGPKKLEESEQPPKGPNLGKVGGSNKPDDGAVDKDIRTSYKSETY